MAGPAQADGAQSPGPARANQSAAALYSCAVVENRSIGPYRLISFSSRDIAGRAAPGQFLMVRSATDQLDPLLPRPLAVHDIDEDVVRMLVEPKGKGTRVLAASDVGQQLHVLGPLGHGFDTAGTAPALIAGGGIGVAPLKLLTARLLRQKRTVRVLLGFRSRREAAAAELFREFDPEIWTDDGSLGRAGLASQALAGHLENTDGPVELFACGPPPMLTAIAAIAAQRDLNLQVALDSHMACGIGSCQGCVTRSKHGFAKVCTDGPVFNAGDLEW